MIEGLLWRMGEACGSFMAAQGFRLEPPTLGKDQGKQERRSPFHSTTSQIQMYLDIMIAFIQLMPIFNRSVAFIIISGSAL